MAALFFGEIAIDPDMPADTFEPALAKETDRVIAAALEGIGDHFGKVGKTVEAGICREAAGRISEYRLRKRLSAIGFSLLGSLAVIVLWTAFALTAFDRNVTTVAKTQDRLPIATGATR